MQRQQVSETATLLYWEVRLATAYESSSNRSGTAIIHAISAIERHKVFFTFKRVSNRSLHAIFAHRTDHTSTASLDAPEPVA